MQLVDRMRERWRHFLGRDLHLDDAESKLRADTAEREFNATLRQVRMARRAFDSRPPPSIGSDLERMQIAGLAADLEEQDKLVREALNDDE